MRHIKWCSTPPSRYLVFISHFTSLSLSVVRASSLPLPAGYLIMTDEWFSEYVYEVVVDKNFLPPEVLDVNQQDPIVLPAWDPMGALA